MTTHRYTRIQRTVLVACIGLFLGLPAMALAAPVGDINCDGQIKANDIILVARLVVGIGFEQSVDYDLDGIHNGCDNCPDTPNEDQLDVDQDGTGDACQTTVGPSPYQAGCLAGGGTWNAIDLTCQRTPNCFLMGLCGQDGAAQDGIDGFYANYTLDDAAAISFLCKTMYVEGKLEIKYAYKYWTTTEKLHVCE